MIVHIGDNDAVGIYQMDHIFFFDVFFYNV